MSFWYPQCAIKLRILLEDFEAKSDVTLQTPYEVVCVARNLTLNVNDYKTADTFTADLDYRYFPFDPRTIRYCGVIIYMENMESLYKPTGALNTIQPNDNNVVFSGYVDDANISFDESNRTVRFEGRDFSSLLMDQKYKENTPINMNSRLDVAIKVYLNQFPATKEITVDNRTGDVLPVIAKFAPGYPGDLAGSKNAGPRETYWEIIQDLCHRAGVICYIDLDKLVITTPRNLYNDSADAKFIYGINVHTLSFKRKLGRLKGFNIRVRSRNGKRVLQADIPREAEQSWCDSFGVTKADQKIPVLNPNGSIDTTKTQQIAPFIAFPVDKVADKGHLIKLGQTVYEDYSRQQIEGKLETSDMETHSGINQADPNWRKYDLTQLEIGQPVAIEIFSDDLAEISRFTSIAQRIEYLIRRNYSQTIASLFAQTMGKFSPRFFTKSYSLTVDQDSGFKFSLDFINIIETKYRGLT